MNEWIKNFVGYLLIASVATQMMPNQKYEQYLRLFTGFLLIVLMLQPILKVGSADAYLEQKVTEFVQEQEALEKEIGTQRDVFLKKSERLQEKSVEILNIEPVRIEVTMDD